MQCVLFFILDLYLINSIEPILYRICNDSVAVVMLGCVIFYYINGIN